MCFHSFGTHFFGLTLARFSLSRVTFLRQLCAYYRVRKKNNQGTPWISLRSILVKVHFDHSVRFQSTLHDVPSLSQKTVYTVVCCLVYKNHVYNTDFLFQLRRGLCSRFFIAVPSPNYSTERKTALAYQQKLPTLLCVTFGL